MTSWLTAFVFLFYFQNQTHIERTSQSEMGSRRHNVSCLPPCGSVANGFLSDSDFSPLM